jgi:A/G-specific adenine glycosylase
VLTRVFAPRAKRKSGKGQRQLWDIATAILPRTGKATWAHNQALMELGALVCTARVMRCEVCPVRVDCLTGSVGGSVEVKLGGVKGGGMRKGGI